MIHIKKNVTWLEVKPVKPLQKYLGNTVLNVIPEVTQL